MLKQNIPDSKKTDGKRYSREQVEEIIELREKYEGMKAMYLPFLGSSGGLRQVAFMSIDTNNEEVFWKTPRGYLNCMMKYDELFGEQIREFGGILGEVEKKLEDSKKQILVERDASLREEKGREMLRA